MSESIAGKLFAFGPFDWSPGIPPLPNKTIVMVDLAEGKSLLAFSSNVAWHNPKVERFTYFAPNPEGWVAANKQWREPISAFPWERSQDGLFRLRVGGEGGWKISQKDGWKAYIEGAGHD